VINTRIKYCLKIFLFLLISFHSYIFGQADLQKQYELALNLFKNEKYFDAITEFKRLLFFEKNNIYTFEANELIGQSYKAGGKFSEAIIYLTYAELNAHSKEEVFRIKTEIVRVNILRKTTGRALQILDELERESDFNKRDEINYWRGWTYIFADEWDNAANSFAQINSNHELKLLSEEIEDEKYSVNLAKAMSFIIPGAGQFYTGNYLSGLISLGWNFLWGFITVNSFIDERIFDGFAVGTLLWSRFYRGNIENAGNFAKEKNLEIVNKALFYLQNEFEGLKP
jgi:tetratricopeptide (TPR) repeat protein